MKRLASVAVLLALLSALAPGVASAVDLGELPDWCAFEGQAWDESTTTCTVDYDKHTGFGDAWVNGSHPPLTIDPGETLVINQDMVLTTNSTEVLPATIINHGTINNNGTLYVDGYGVIENHGTINSSYEIVNGGSIDNQGTINDDSLGSCSPPADPRFVNMGGTINNSGTINKNSGCLVQDGILNNNGTINNYATIHNNSDDDEVINNNGTLDNYGELTNFGVIHNRGFVVLHPNVGSIVNSTDATIFNYRCPGETGVLTAQGNVENYGDIVHLVGKACPAAEATE